MVDSTNQSVVNDPNPDATAPAAGSDAQDDDFDALLKQYDGVVQQQTPAAPAQAPQEPEAPRTVEARIEALERERLAMAEQQLIQETKAAIDGAVTKVKGTLGELPVAVTDKMIRGYLAETAQEDPRFMSAFETRHSDPAKWERIVAALGRQMAKELGNAPDKAATDSRAAVTAAVRASTTPGTDAQPKNWNSMSNAEFEQEAQRLARGGR